MLDGEFILDKSLLTTKLTWNCRAITPPPKILAKLLKWTVHTLEIFWWEEDYCGPADVEPEDAECLLWSVHVEYSNGEIQDMKSEDDMPDHVLELLSALAELFE